MRSSLLRIAVVVLCGLVVLPAQAAETLRIYRLDGSKQCEAGPGAASRVMRKSCAGLASASAR